MEKKTYYIQYFRSNNELENKKVTWELLDTFVVGDSCIPICNDISELASLDVLLPDYYNFDEKKLIIKGI